MSAVYTEQQKQDWASGRMCSEANQDMQDELQQVKTFLCSPKSMNGGLFPRFGLLGLKAQNTPMFVYDHPELCKITKTAFTDGIHIFVCADFMRRLVKEENEARGSSQSCELLMLHELMHMLMNHVDRLKSFPKDIANKAEDLVINAKLQLAFPDMKATKTLEELGMGFKSGQAEKFHNLAEETVAKMLMEEEKKKEQQQKDQQKNQQGGGQGQQQPGQGQGQQQPGQGKGQGQPQKGGSQGDQQGQGGGGEGDEEENDDGNGNDQNHTITPEELIQRMEKAGLQNVLDKLQLPASHDVEEIAKIKEEIRMKDIDSVEKAAAQRAQVGGQYPGDHIIDAVAEKLTGFREGKLGWKLGLTDMLLGGGMKFKKSEEEADLVYYLDPNDMNISDPIYTGSFLPHKPDEAILCLMDTSGSVDDKMLREFISEVLALKKGASGVSDTASEVFLLSADTVLRGEMLEINDDNVDELLEKGVNVFGRGGTDIERCMRSALALEGLKEKKIKAVVYFTDLCDHPPSAKFFEEYKEKFTMAFITTPHMYQEEFTKQVSPFARVYPIEEGLEVDLTKDALDNTPVNVRANKMR